MSSTALQEKYKLVADTIRAYPFQLLQAWDEIKRVQLPNDYTNIERIVFCGMGGSALGARIVKSIFFDRLLVPFEIVNDYGVPGYVNEKTLVVVSSYSGSTEETLASLSEAQMRNAKIVGITTGGKLSERLKEEQLPAYLFDPKHNPSGQPRMSIGYACGSTLGLLSKLGVLLIHNDEIEGAVAAMHTALSEFHENASVTTNRAKKVAYDLQAKVPVLVASEHLSGVGHTIKNQFNESAKTYCNLYDLPELNHHLLEGLQNPLKAKQLLHFVFLRSNLYNPRIQKRYDVTGNVLEKNGVSYSIYEPISETRIAQAFETLIFGSFSVFERTSSLKIDPIIIPWVDYFKEQLAK